MKNLIAIAYLLSLMVANGFATETASALATAEDALEAKDYAEAKRLLVRIIEAEPDNARAKFALGMAEFGLEDLAASEKALNEAIALDGERADYYSSRALVLVKKAEGMNMFASGPVYMKSLEDNKKAVALDPDNMQSHIGLARYYSNAPKIAGGSIELAKEHAAEVFRIEPYQGYVEQALIANRENRPDEAIESFKAAIELNPAEAWLHFELGKLHQLTGDMLRAKAAYEAALQADPDHEGARSALEAFK